MIPWRREWQPTPVFLSGESHGWRSLAGYGPWGQKESDTTEQLIGFFFSNIAGICILIAVHIVVQQKPTQHCKASIFQLKNKGIWAYRHDIGLEEVACK